MKMHYDLSLSDDEWREANFVDADIQSARLAQRHGKPTPDELIKCAAKYGSDGILESAIMLTQRQYRHIEEVLKKQEDDRTVARKRSRSVV